MKIIIALGVFIGITNGAPLSPPPESFDYDLLAIEIGKAVHDFLSEARILKMLQLFAVSSSDAKLLVDGFQEVEDEAFKCFIDALMNDETDYHSQNNTSVKEISINAIRKVAKNECYTFYFQLNNLASTIEKARLPRVFENLHLVDNIPESLPIFKFVIIFLPDFFRKNKSEDFQEVTKIQAIKFIQSRLDADNATISSVIEDQPFTAEILLPNGTYHAAYRTYLEQTILNVDKTYPLETFFKAYAQLFDYQVKALPASLKWMQNKLDDVIVPANIADGVTVSDAAHRIRVFLSEAFPDKPGVVLADNDFK